MVCEACLRENDPFAKYCCDCGRSLTGQADAPSGVAGVWSDRARRCASCGETIAPRSRFCSACGMAPVTTARRSRRSGLTVSVIVVGLVAIFAAAAAIIIPGHFG